MKRSFFLILEFKTSKRKRDVPIEGLSFTRYPNMSETIGATIQIGGKAAESLVPGLCERISREVVALDWGEGRFSPMAEEDLLEAREDRMPAHPKRLGLGRFGRRTGKASGIRFRILHSIALRLACLTPLG